MKCSVFQATDKKLLLFVMNAHCTGNSSPQSGQSASDQLSKTDDEVIAHPTVELWHHCLLRGANLGSFVAIVFGTPALLYKGVRHPTALLQRLAGISTYGVVCNY